MVIMALDHVRDFVHSEAFRGNPTDLTTTTPALFLTRWITHLCAPSFVFLAGAALAFSVERRQRAGATAASIDLHIAVRALLLILFDVAIISPSFAGSFDVVLLGVLYGIGTSLLFMIGLRRLPTAWLLGLLAQLLAPSPYGPHVGLPLYAAAFAWERRTVFWRYAAPLQAVYGMLVPLWLGAGYEMIPHATVAPLAWLTTRLFPYRTPAPEVEQTVLGLKL